MTGMELLKLMDEAGIEYMTGCRCIYKLQISDLAKFIDEYFLPRPLFEDGTPVKVGGEFALHKPNEGKEVISYCVRNDGSFSISGFLYDQDQRVMKPKQPEALDADGEPIKVGDELYLTDGFIIKLKCVGFSNDGLVKVTNWGSSEGWVPILVEANELTHKKPDSWEQLEKDAILNPYNYCCLRNIDSEHGFASELKAKDLIRRAKALAVEWEEVKDE